MRVLVVEDDPVHRRLIEHLLERWGYAVLTAADGAAAWRRLESEPAIPLVIADWEMPEMDGLALCRAIRGKFAEPYVYVILLTARDERDDMLQGFEAGADDYLTKPVHPSELNARVRAAQRILDLQQKLLEAQERLRVQAMHDALTGIYNRGAVFDALSQELERARRQQSSLAAIMIDLDHFKQVNDRHGHLVGDQVLRETAQRIRGLVRSYDTVGRYGGEEFLVVAPGFAGAPAMDLAERLRLAFAGNPIQTSGPTVPQTLSLGVVAVEPGRSVEITELLAAADDALYRAKAGGRNLAVAGTADGKEQ
jgi:two-component system, cell cycle response regulator